MTATERDVAHEAIGGTVRPIPYDPSRLVVRLSGGLRTVNLTFAEAEALSRELRQAVFAYAPEMRRVLGYDSGGTEPRVLASETDASVYAAEGWDLIRGLQCPHEDCGYVGWHDEGDAVWVVDEDERWSYASYEHSEEDGKVYERVVTGGADSDYSGLGYRCCACSRPVFLPDDVDEVWH